MAKLLSIKEANEIVQAMANEYGVIPIRFSHYYCRERKMWRVRGLQKNPRSDLWILRWWKEKHVVLDCDYNLEFAVKRAIVLIKEMDSRVQEAEKIRKDYANYLLDEELKRE